MDIFFYLITDVTSCNSDPETSKDTSSQMQTGGMFAGVGYFPAVDKQSSHDSKETGLRQQPHLQSKPESLLR